MTGNIGLERGETTTKEGGGGRLDAAAGTKAIPPAGAAPANRHGISYERYLQIPTFMRQGKRLQHR